MRPLFFIKFEKCLLTNLPAFCIINKPFGTRSYGGVAQLARAFGSYPECHPFKSDRRYQNGAKFALLRFLFFAAFWNRSSLLHAAIFYIVAYAS